MAETPDEIWSDDSFNRRQEAENIVGYLESVAGRPRLGHDNGGHVLAIDAGYGEGKTFFLARLAKHLAINHPVAFIDAWVDDLHDEPLVAIASNLQDALAPYSKGRVAKSLASFSQSAARVSKVVATGLLKRTLGLLITQGAVELLSDELAANEINQDAAKDGGKGLVDEAAGALSERSAFEQKMTAFRQGRQAIITMRESLAEVVEALADGPATPPIVIIIDELDRCRPSYALKLLEEVKHLFSAEGVVFILGMNEEQLSHSVSGAYGGGFDGRSYLRRFVDRRYVLENPPREQLVREAISTLGIDTNRLEAPNVTLRRQGAGQLDPADLIIRYLNACALPARDALRFFEALQLCLALIPANQKLFSPYIFPLIIESISNKKISECVFNWSYWVPTSLDSFRQDRGYQELTPQSMFSQISAASQKPFSELNSHNYEGLSYAEQIVLHGNVGTDPPLYETMPGYRRLVGAVSRFTTTEAQ